jgi:hypothetical protein
MVKSTPAIGKIDTVDFMVCLQRYYEEKGIQLWTMEFPILPWYIRWLE